MDLSAKLSELKPKMAYWIALVILLFFPSFAAFAATCPAGHVSSTLEPAEYQWPKTSAVGSTSSLDDVTITGSMTTIGSSQSISGAVNPSSTIDGAFFIKQDMNSKNDTNTVTYKFDKPLSNLNISVYHINRALWSFLYGYDWIDRVQFIAKDKSNGNVLPELGDPGGFISTSVDTAFADSELFELCSDNDFSNRCKVTASFKEPISELSIVYGNTNGARNNPEEQNIAVTFGDFCVPVPAYTISKDDGLTSIGTNNTTNYIIKITNTGGTSLQDIVLKDPAVLGLSKQSNITCDSTDTNNVCTTSSLPTTALLEGATGFKVPSIPVDKSYSIKVPTLVTAASGTTVTSTATIKTTDLDLKSASDSNEVTSIFGGGYPVAPASCPSGHKMYYIGSNPPSHTPKEVRSIDWTTGSFAKEYVFGNTKFNLAFTDRKNLQTGYPTGANYPDATTNAVNMYHNSFRTDIDHRLTATINKPVSKYGLAVQDLDSNQPGRYIESITLTSPGGVFSRTENKPFQLSNGNQTISGTEWNNCSTSSPCNFNIDWGYKAAQTPFTITHGNTYSGGSTSSSSGAYVVGYSDFYFCLAPPKLVVKKQLNGTRIHDTDAKRDQFNIKVSGGTLNPDANNSPASFTTTGSGQTISNTSNLISLTPATTYTITESVLNGTNLGEITNYDTSYTCTNATAGSTMPSGATSSFTLSNLNYGDEVTCTITNTPKTYTFSGIVFNDNGGITGSNASATNANITTGPYANNSSYFNGIFNPTQETGVTGSTVKLVDCSTPSTVYATQAVSATGFYQISAPAITINSNLNNICLVEERSSDGYPIRTNNASKKITILASTYNYPNNNFGRVIAENVALVLTKYQYINNCPSTLDYTGISESTTPITGFSTASIDKIEPGQCIAYKITATNRANVSIDNFVMQDRLQKSGVNNATATSVLANPALDLADYDSGSPAIGQNGTIKTRTLVLNPRTKRDFYFNTKYGTTMNPQ
ncbi:hypothetical protein ACI2I3_02960 [Psychrobacter namhaensis]|uniref:SpaA-like prealbumin fold domain-containing protein n=1 Tax=Psychrobacter namhaensis TaxID=292734 RepID=A0ABW8L5X1_9GAMM